MRHCIYSLSDGTRCKTFSHSEICWSHKINKTIIHPDVILQLQNDNELIKSFPQCIKDIISIYVFNCWEPIPEKEKIGKIYPDYFFENGYLTSFLIEKLSNEIGFKVEKIDVIAFNIGDTVKILTESSDTFAEYYIKNESCTYAAKNKCCELGKLDRLKLLYKYDHYGMGNTLYYAVKHNHLDICKFLISIGQNKEEGLRQSSRFGHFNLVKYFLSIGATNFNAALKYCCISDTPKDNSKMVDYMLKLGATDISSALVVAKCWNNKNAYNYLIKFV